MTTVLLVEDDELMRRLGMRVLEHAGYTVLVAEDGVTALRLAQTHPGPIELVVVDVVLPDMSGLEVAERLVELRPGLRVIFVSSYPPERVVQAGVFPSWHIFLPKPFKPEELYRKVREVLQA